MTDLWQDQRQKRRAAVEPLAVRMRPRTLEEFFGQGHFLGEGKLLRRMLAADRLTSVIFWGPPGTGKTTLAEIIANQQGRHFARGNAAMIGVKEVRAVIADAARRLEEYGTRSVLFLDEIHRFSRNQQDVLLGDVENGLITLIGATTENPYFTINSALVSRSTLFQFEPLGEADVRDLLRRAIADPERGYGNLSLRVDDDAVDAWARMSDGDARRALSGLEVAVLSSGGGDHLTPSPSPQAEGARHAAEDDAAATIKIDRAAAEDSMQRKAIVYDGTGDEHYDVISAFIKSMRGSDPDAAVYWLARMLEAGEDPRFIARRIAILASEDIGNADPQAIQIAAAAYSITERIGMPECQLTLAQAAIYMCCAPKSKASANAIWAAAKDVREGRTIPVPKALRDAHYAGAKELGHGSGYVDPHKQAGGFADQEYLGVDRVFYVPTDRGREAVFREYLNSLRSGKQPDGKCPNKEVGAGRADHARATEHLED